MSLKIETWYELELEDRVKRFLINQLMFNAYLWNTLLEHFVNYLKSKEEIKFTYEELLAIQMYALETFNSHDYLLPEIFNETTRRFDFSIHQLYINRPTSQPSLLRVNIQDPLFIPSNAFSVDKDTKEIKLLDENNSITIGLNDDITIPKYSLGIKIKYTNSNNKENFSFTFI